MRSGGLCDFSRKGENSAGIELVLCALRFIAGSVFCLKVYRGSVLVMKKR
jgi:hypothetical protein